MKEAHDFLAGIIARKRARLAEARRARSLEELAIKALGVRKGHDPCALSSALRRGDGVNIIAEIKRASPSKGSIRQMVVPAEIAASYAEGGAAAVSVLTEEDNFRGSLEDLREVRAAVRLPLLRKDFIFDEYQLYEAAEAGADALLLISAALEDEALSRLRLIAEEDLGMDALVEVHTAEEFRRAQGCGATLIGVNNRNLHTFEVSLDTSVELARHAPANILLISESGLRSRDDLLRLRALGYRGFLIGEALMRAEHPAEFLRSLIGQSER